MPEHKAVQTEDVTDPTQSIDYRMCTDGRQYSTSLVTIELHRITRMCSLIPRP